ncbi:hypothetical protein CVU83_00575 [Candidatus Falkowbacteria bacterium HGW-Falkowbacteria-2]|uniref:Uncharacterized protein n=1 Tax=Candidatus Falkowbacteria bacterium HGW-Falkowbacteria-2 TaxID=2013769 RepID=A0A2N2E349_9BACT|nr:MAG: hypothetical protein CVU83_00575 [Candidatus Falkowbacteria bacterium HGW-Falkowbacteria-2]
MKTTIIGGTHERNMWMYLENHLGPEELDYEDLVIIDVNTLENDEQLFTDRVGLRIAMDYVNDPDKIIILMGQEPEEVLWSVPEFIELMSRSNVDFVDFLDPHLIPDLYQKLSNRKNSYRDNAQGTLT